MIINDAGEYTLKYTATDACGNSTVVERGLTVEAPPTYRTVLYTDGTFIINESSRDEAANVAAHGQPTNVYIPFNPNGETNEEKYIFSGITQRPWNNERSSILSVKIGSQIQPTDTSNWFRSLSNVASISLTNLDTSNVTSMSHMFRECWKLESLDFGNSFNTSNVENMSYMFDECSILVDLDLSGFNTSSVTTMYYMFGACRLITSLDLSSFDTSNVTSTGYMFNLCTALKTIYVSNNFNTTQVTTSTSMFSSCTNLVGGSGTVWSDSNPRDKTYAHIDGGVSDPGYFTAKS